MRLALRCWPPVAKPRAGVVGQVVGIEAGEVAVALGVEAERSGERVDDLWARGDGAALFEPREPRHAHARELGDLLSA